nr:hypothetical protein [Ishige okamurae]
MYLYGLKKILNSFFFRVSWLEIFCFFLFILLGIILDQKFNIKKPRKWFLAFNGVVIQRFFAVLAYYIPYLEVLNTHIPIIEKAHPFLVTLFLPNFIADSLEVFQQIPFLHFFYLMIGYGVLIRYKIPKDRFIRFNLMYSILLISFQGIFGEIFGYYVNSKLFCPSTEDKAEAGLVMLIFWLLAFIPCFLRAILGRYTSNAFMREAVEVHLGRDGPDFIWWDRRKKDKKPKKPKK